MFWDFTTRFQSVYKKIKTIYILQFGKGGKKTKKIIERESVPDVQISFLGYCLNIKAWLRPPQIGMRAYIDALCSCYPLRQHILKAGSTSHMIKTKP